MEPISASVNTQPAGQPPIRRRLLAELIPNPDNPRDRNPAAFAGLVDSIQKYGLLEGAPCALQPIIVNQHPDFLNVIVGGEQRWAAAQEAGYTEAWTVDVTLDADQLKELTIRLNVPAGDWDWEQLAEQSSGEQLLFFGFRDLELPNLPADERLTLEGTDVTVGDANRKAAAKKGSTEAPPLPESLTRQYLVFLNGPDYDRFVSNVQAIKDHYGIKINSDAILRALDEVVSSIPTPNAT